MSKMRNWILNSYDQEQIREIVEHGCISGAASGLIYYEETRKFHGEHEEEIWEMLCEDAEGQDLCVMEFVAILNGAHAVVTHEKFLNLIVWYAVERVCAEVLV